MVRSPGEFYSGDVIWLRHLSPFGRVVGLVMGQAPHRSQAPYDFPALQVRILFGVPDYWSPGEEIRIEAIYECRLVVPSGASAQMRKLLLALHGLPEPDPELLKFDYTATYVT